MQYSKMLLNLGKGSWGSQPALPAWARKMKHQQLVNISAQFKPSDDEDDNTPICINFGDLLVGDMKPIELSTFFDYFAQEPEMYWRLHEVCEDYGSVRPVRHDIDCFYRSFAFGFLEVMMRNRYEAAAAGLLIRYAQMNTELPQSIRAKFMAASELALDFVVGLEYGDLNVDDIAELLNDNDKSALIVWFLRWLAASQIQREKARFQPIMEYLGYDIDQYCRENVESPGKAADPIQVMALTDAVGMSIRVEYVEDEVEDSPEDEALRKSQAQPASWVPPFCLLSYYGHYDVLYRRDVSVDGPFTPL